jgi:hypothetical protein
VGLAEDLPDTFGLDIPGEYAGAEFDAGRCCRILNRILRARAGSPEIP